LNLFLYLTPVIQKATAQPSLFSDQTITVDGSGAAADGSILTITQPGTYILSGTLSEGQVRVETVDEADVQIVLDGATITNSTGAAIYVKSANSATITLAEGTTNTLSDGEIYTFEDSEDEPDATLFSKSDLILNGTGTLVIDANYAHAIKGKDDVTIAEGTYDITSVGDAIKGRDSLFISSGTFTIVAGADGLQSTNEEEEGKGILTIESGTFTIICSRGRHPSRNQSADTWWRLYDHNRRRQREQQHNKRSMGNMGSTY